MYIHICIYIYIYIYSKHTYMMFTIHMQVYGYTCCWRSGRPGRPSRSTLRAGRPASRRRRVCSYVVRAFVQDSRRSIKCNEVVQNVIKMVAASDPVYLSRQKIRFNSAMRNYQAGQIAIDDTGRNRQMLQNLYDSTPGQGIHKRTYKNISKI